MKNPDPTKRTRFVAWLAAGAFWLPASLLCAQAQLNPMLHAANAEVVDSGGAPVLLRGVNLTPWLDPEPYLIGRGLWALLLSPSELKQNLADIAGAEQAQSFWRQWEDAFVTEEDFRRLSSEGFNCVRLPINYKDIVSKAENGAVTLDKSGLQAVDRAVAWGKEYGIHVILDLHVAPGGQNPVATVADIPSTDKTARLWQGSAAGQNQALLVAIWRELAARYAGATSIGGYDLLNEPALPRDAPKDALPNLYKAIISAIRGVDPYHMVILEGDKYARDFSALAPPPDANLMYEFHEYAIFNRAWNAPNQKALDEFLQLRAATRIPLFLGEFGEGSQDWQRQMVGLMKANRIGWAVWPWKRIELGNGHPVIETIAMPDLWNKLSRYITGAPFAPKPVPAEARQGMSEMLEAVRTANCKEDAGLAGILAGK